MARLFEAVRIRATGFPYRKLHHQFYRNYKVCLPQKLRIFHEKDSSLDEIQLNSAILKHLSDVIDTNDIRIGKTKVFYKATQLAVLEQARNDAIIHTVVHIQANARRYLAKKRLKELRELQNVCTRALRSRNIKALHDAIKALKEKSIELSIEKQVKELIQFLDFQKKLAQQLEVAIKEKNIDKLQGSLIQAEHLHIRVNSLLVFSTENL
jgi:myosin heavy subunit